VLFEQGYRFDFFQAVRVLERLFPDRLPVGREASPAREVARFRSQLSLSFPASQISEVVRPGEGKGPAQMTVAFMGLTGLLGVLPRHYTEMLLERVRRRDFTLRDFLDLFNHRLISLFYRAWEKYRFPISYERAAATGERFDSFSLHLFDVIGMGTKGLQGRLEVADEALLFYAGLIAQSPRSASALEGVLRDYFTVPSRVSQFTGQWLPLAVENRTRPGPRDRNNILGASAVLGHRVWDQHAKFRVRLGPLSLAQFCQFLPVGDAFRQLAQLTGFFANQEVDFDLQLAVKAAEVPWCRLGEKGDSGPRLGWSTWLKTRAFDHDADDPVFGPSLTRAASIPAARASTKERSAS
jgi:type VI secretion system protein ImpH